MMYAELFLRYPVDFQLNPRNEFIDVPFDFEGRLDERGARPRRRRGRKKRNQRVVPRHAHRLLDSASTLTEVVHHTSSKSCAIWQ